MSDRGIPRQLDLFAKDHPKPSADTMVCDAPRESDVAYEIPKASELTDLCVELTEQLGLTKLSRRVHVEWNTRMRTAAGRAHYRDARIELNPSLAALPGIDAKSEVDRTLRHELAHLVAFTRAKGIRIQPHGNEWRQACSDLGIPDEARCHSLPFKPRQVKRKFLYECPACSEQVPRVRKFRRPVACYTCCKKNNSGRYDPRFKLREAIGGSN